MGENEHARMSNRGKDKTEQKKRELSLLRHRWRTCLCSTLRFYDVWTLSKLWLGGKYHIRSVKFFLSLFFSLRLLLSRCEVLVIVTTLLS